MAKTDLKYCPECECKLIFQEGCIHCPNCGWGLCD